jgi:hypothetical protein
MLFLDNLFGQIVKLNLNGNPFIPGFNGLVSIFPLSSSALQLLFLTKECKLDKQHFMLNGKE